MIRGDIPVVESNALPLLAWKLHSLGPPYRVAVIDLLIGGIW